MNIEKLWNEKRWLFWLLLPVVLIFIAFRIFEKFQVHKAEKSIIKAEEKNKKLEEKVYENALEISKKKTKIEEKKKTITEREVNDILLDWHKRFKL